MTPILERSAAALVEATPEWWTDATMRVEVSQHPGGVTGMPHTITSSRHPRDIVVATEDIQDGTYSLQQLCAEAGQPWSALVFRIEQIDGAWRFSTDFEYPA